MADSAQHLLWISRGSPFTLARPLARLRDRLRAAGYTVYDIGNDSHLDHQPPEDHTPYSETGWPGTSPYGVGMAIDIMPPPAGRGLPSLQVLGRRLFDDRTAGRAPFIKYMNWGPASNTSAVQDRWMPGHERRASSDAGHIHISARTDYAASAVADDYNPLSVGGTMELNSSVPIPIWDSPPDEWGIGLTPANEAQEVGTILGGAHRRLFMLVRGLIYVSAQMKASAAADAVRDQAVLAAVKALTVATGADPQPILDAIAAARAETHDLVVQLQQQLATVQARNVKLAAALAAAGGSLEAADD